MMRDQESYDEGYSDGIEAGREKQQSLLAKILELYQWEDPYEWGDNMEPFCKLCGAQRYVYPDRYVYPGPQRKEGTHNEGCPWLEIAELIKADV